MVSEASTHANGGALTGTGAVTIEEVAATAGVLGRPCRAS